MSKLSDHYEVVPLVRYSDGQKQSDLSNKSQLCEITRRIELEGHGANIPFYVQAAHTGRDRNRKQLEDAYNKIKRHNRTARRPVTLLLMLKWDRWFRNALASVEWVIKFQDIGVMVNSATEWVSYGTGKDLLQFFIHQSMAQDYSDSLSDHTIRNQKACLRRGYNPYQTGRYFTRIRDHQGLKQNAWSDFAPKLKQAGELIATGSTIINAYGSTGGRDVHGSIQAFTDTIKNEKLQARFKGYKMNYPPLWSEAVWLKIQDQLKAKRVLTRKEKALQDAYLCGILRGDPCNGRASRDTQYKRNKKRQIISRHPYYICTCKADGKRVNHYRYRRAEVNADFKEMLKEIGLSANRQKQLSVKARDRSEKQLKELKAEQKRLQKLQAEYDQMQNEARRLLLKGIITPKDKEDTEREARQIAVQLDDVSDQIDRYGQILESVLKDVANVGTFLYETSDYLQIRDFTKMLFPDGLWYDAKKRAFHTTSMNAAFCLIDVESVSYSRIKLGCPLNEVDTPAMGGRPGYNRTPQSDLQLYRAYCYKYNIA